MSDSKILLKADATSIRLTKESDGKIQVVASAIDGEHATVLVGQKLDVRLVEGSILVTLLDIEPVAAAAAPIEKAATANDL